MNLVKKILVVHSDASVRRRLLLLLAASGFDVRSCSTVDGATALAHDEWFDLALVDHDLPDAGGFLAVETLKKIQPTLPLLLLVRQLDLAIVVQAIRFGIADVLADDDQANVLRRVCALLHPQMPGEGEVTPEELAQVESMLDAIASATASSATPFTATHEPSADLLQVSKEKALLEARAARLQHEKAALEAELKTLLTQNADATRFQAELAELRTERELAAATQAVIDEKARALSQMRDAIANERTKLEAERKRLESAPPFPSKNEDELTRERAELKALRQRLDAEEIALDEEAARLRQQTMQLAQERRRWHEDLDLLRTEEANLRAYEARLRQTQAQLEADRVSLSSAARPPSRSPFTDDVAIRDAWAKVQRASELMEAERANLRDDRLTLREHESAVRRREEAVRDREIQLSMAEKKIIEAPASAADTVRSITRAPFDMAKAVFGGPKK